MSDAARAAGLGRQLSHPDIGIHIRPSPNPLQFPHLQERDEARTALETAQAGAPVANGKRSADEDIEQPTKKVGAISKCNVTCALRSQSSLQTGDGHPRSNSSFVINPLA